MGYAEAKKGSMYKRSRILLDLMHHSLQQFQIQIENSEEKQLKACKGGNPLYICKFIIEKKEKLPCSRRGVD